LTAALGAFLAVPGVIVATFALYLLALAVASAIARRDRSVGAGTPGRHLAVVVPAHNEELLVARCVKSLLDQTYPPALYRVIVVADNCTDATASIASGAGAEVMVRTEPQARGKGHALRWAMDQLVAAPDPPDAVVVVDADSVADCHLLSTLEAELARGHNVVQADYTVMCDEQSSRRTRLVAAGFLLFHRVRFSGRAALGMAANLVGNGMLFSRSVLERCPWSAFTGVEDLEYSIDLRLAGFRPRFTALASVSGPGPATRSGELGQRVRWEGGRFHVMRTRLWALLRGAVARRDMRLLDAAVDLATPPLGILAAATCAGFAVTLAAVAMGVAPLWALITWTLALVALPGFVVIGLAAARAPRRLWTAIIGAPFYVAWKMAAYVSIARRFDPNRWERSDRGDAPSPRRVEISGVPIDAIDMPTAVARLRAAIGAGKLVQVSTINLDFLARAQHDRGVMGIFRRTDLNLADGAPVVWLGRMLGVEMPGRVAGADLVPALLQDLSGCGSRVFLLGGEQGAAAAAGARLLEMYPGIVVAGTYEPPRTAIGEMDNAGILRRIAEARADVLLVALGHPKQERWIDQHRDRLTVSVAIGVGCVFDLIAGRSRRAPKWMQAAGLEWLYRLAREPRRLLGRYVVDAIWLLRLTARVLRERLAARQIVEAA
jgi:exopolysaccharide biosynthesis WecB/TagA/CpsF family protein